MNFKEKLACVPLPSGSHCFPSIEHLSSLERNFTGNDSPLNNSKSTDPPDDDDEADSAPQVNIPQKPSQPLRQSGASQDVSVFNVDAVIREVNKSGARMTGQVIIDKVLRTPFEKLHYLRGEFDSLYNLINERGGDAASLKNKIERLIHQACDLKDLQESYSGRMTTEVRENHLIEVGGKLNEASRQLDAESTRHEALKTESEQVKLRREVLLKELQSLDDQQKCLDCQLVASEDLLEAAERAVTDLKGQIDILHATEVIDPTTKASLEKTETYVKESFEELKTFQWTP